MPGPAMHHLIADELRKKINSSQGLGGSADYSRLQSLLSDPKNLPYYFLGCQGPDFLFFNMKDWPLGPLGDAAALYYKVYDAIEGFEKKMKDLVPQPIIDLLDAAGYAADQVVSNSSTLSELESLFSDMQAVLDALAASLTEMIKDFLTDMNLFEILKHPYTDGQDKGKWWWFDTLHYRKTGRYVAQLLKDAPEDSPLYLYALGYLTHVTGDTVGHPYVNINCGGPYRNQSQRHKTSENYHDVYNLSQVMGVDWNRSRWHTFYNFNFDGTTSAPGASEEVPDPSSHMPDKLAEFLSETMQKIYAQGDSDDDEYGYKISPEDINNAYRAYYSWLKKATETGTLPLPIPYSFTAELEEVWEQAMDNLGDIGDFIEDAVDTAGSFSFLAIFIVLAALILAAVAAAAALIDAILGALTTLSVAGIRYAASLVYEQLYNAYQNFRLGVALNGLAYPMQEHLNEPRFRQFQSTNLPDMIGQVAANFASQLPKKEMPLVSNGLSSAIINALFNREKHLIYPPAATVPNTPYGATPGENDPAQGGPRSYFSAAASFYIYGDIPLDPAFIDMLAELEGEEEKHRAYVKEHKGPQLGNALRLSEEIYDRWKTGKKIPDFNLDADRGYAYTCWVQKGDTREELRALEDSPAVKLHFIQP
jgi:hypothetical protein